MATLRSGARGCAADETRTAARAGPKIRYPPHVAELRPVAPPERVAALDVIRGWALLGVMVANVHEIVSGRRYGPEPADTTTLDVVATRFIEIVISGKSITLLTCLFGLGFAVQLLRADERGAEVGGLFVRRLAVLLAIGVCHATFVWWGDVTWTYAVTGFALLAFRRTGDRALLAWAIVLVFVPRLVMAVPAIGHAVHAALPPLPATFNAQMLAAALGHDYAARMSAHLHQVLYHVSYVGPWYLPWLVGHFLLGYYAGKRRLFDRDGAAHLPLFRQLLTWGLAFGVAGSAMSLLRRSSMMAHVELLLPAQLGLVVLSELTLLGLAIAYASAIVLMIQRPTPRRYLLVLAPVGRMPLTTYLTQSVATTFVFYGWGLGLMGQVGSAGCLALTLVIFALQIAASHLWLRRFRFGPAEWLWRTLVYRRVQPMRG
jgi:uncharacterized protein